MEQVPVTRVCKKCGEEKTLDSFTKNKNCKYGREHTCLKCTLIRVNTFSNNNQQLVKKYKNDWYEKSKLDEEYKKKTIEYKRNYRKNNPNYVKYWNDIAHLKYAHKKHEYAKTYREKHTEKLKLYSKNRFQFNKNNLTDTFIKSIIVRRSVLKNSDIPQELIELMRKYLKLRKDAKKAKENNGN